MTKLSQASDAVGKRRWRESDANADASREESPLSMTALMSDVSRVLSLQRHTATYSELLVLAGNPL